MKNFNPRDLFDYTKTDKRSYTKILNHPITPKKKTRGTKNKVMSHRPVGKIVMLPPLVAIRNSYAKTDVTSEKIRHPQFKPGSFKVKWPLPFIDTMSKRGYGRGRMLLCAKWGIKEIPVLIVARSEDSIDKWVNSAHKKGILKRMVTRGKKAKK